MIEIVKSVNQVSQIISEIATATAEQSSGIAQAHASVSQLDKVTQQNAALVEESTAASESLRILAVEMTDAVSVFRLSEDAAKADPAPEAQRAEAPAAQQPIASPFAPMPVPNRVALAGNAGDDWTEF